MRLKPKSRKSAAAAWQRKRRTANDRGYNYRWQKRSAAFRRQHPLCVQCGLDPLDPVPAEVVDHIIPHKGDHRLFWDRSNWQSLCKRCHDRKTRAENY